MIWCASRKVCLQITCLFYGICMSTAGLREDYVRLILLMCKLCFEIGREKCLILMFYVGQVTRLEIGWRFGFRYGL